MNGIRKLLLFAMATMLIALLPVTSMAAGPTKQWSILVTPNPLPSTSDVQVTIKIKNETPGGNSTINSLKLVMPTGYTVNTAHVGGNPVTAAWPGTLDTSQSGVIAFSNISPLKPQSSFTMIAYLNIATGPGQAGCTATSWMSSMSWTGSSFTGNTFLLISSTSTNVDPKNALAFQSVTGNVPIGTDITGSVQATSCGAAPSPAVSVKVNLVNSASVVVATATTATDGSGIVAIDFATTAIPAGSYTLKASVPADASYAPISTGVTVCGNALSFTGQPSNIQLYSDFPTNTVFASTSATVHADSCGNPGSVTVTAKLFDSGGAQVGNSQMTATDPNTGNVTFQFTPAAVGTYTIKATAANYSDATSNAFRVFGGLLNCEPTEPFTFGDDPNGDITQEGYASGTRGYWNKDGVSCSPLFYTFTNTILTDNTVHLEWDTSTGQHPAFTYIMTWKTEDVDNATTVDPDTNAIRFGWPFARRVFTAWTVDGSGNPNFVAAQACISPDLPAPYGQLSGGIGAANQGDIQNISVTTPAANVPNGFPTATLPMTGPPNPTVITPFPMVIGTERMLVNSVNGSTWNVTRGVGGTTASAHNDKDYVMSTPLPLDSTGTQVPMCVQSHAWQSVGFDAATGLAEIRYTTRVFDIGDGWVGLR